MTDIERFFTALSERAHKENDLSDLTYAMCEADLVFKQFFLDFFFKEERIDASRAIIKREYSEVWGRPDFHIQAGGKRYIVEVKIWDGNHHFEQYFNILAKKELGAGAKLENMETGQDDWKRFGYIANYDSIKDVVAFTDTSGRNVKAGKLCHVATWKEFVMELERYKSFNDPVISAYTKYVRKVCPFDDFQIKPDWKISIKDFLNIKDFDKAIEKAITECGCTEYGLSFDSNSYMRRLFEWNEYNGKSVCGWLGACYTNKGAVVGVTFKNKSGWGDLVCNDSNYQSHVKDGALGIFSVDSVALVDLTAFLKNVLERIKDGTVFHDDSGLVDDKDCAKITRYSNTLLAMKSLSFALERYLLDDELVTNLKTMRYEITLTCRNDQEVPGSHCGRYFELRKIIDDNSAGTSNMTFLGWIGVLYNSECIRDGGANYGDEPSLEISIRKETVCPVGWQGNSWGWWCFDIQKKNDAEMFWREALAKVRNQIYYLVTAISQKYP